jgi:hypothetical protein
MATEQLYQAIVETKGGEQIAVTPKMGLPAVEQIAAAVQASIVRGQHPDWSMPVIVPVLSTRSH